MFDVSLALDCFARTVSFRRPASACDANGFPVEADEEEFSTKAVVYPATSRDMSLVPEGQRSSESLVVFTKQKLNGVQDPAGQTGDLFDEGGETYEIQSVATWGPSSGSYFRSVATKVPVR